MAINHLERQERNTQPKEDFRFLEWISDHSVDMGVNDLAENHDKYDKYEK